MTLETVNCTYFSFSSRRKQKKNFCIKQTFYAHIYTGTIEKHFWQGLLLNSKDATSLKFVVHWGVALALYPQKDSQNSNYNSTRNDRFVSA